LSLNYFLFKLADFLKSILWLGIFLTVRGKDGGGSRLTLKPSDNPTATSLEWEDGSEGNSPTVLPSSRHFCQQLYNVHLMYSIVHLKFNIPQSYKIHSGCGGLLVAHQTATQ
jgi:hypothetical protein